MPTYRTLKIFATILAAKVQERYRLATPAEESYALTDEEAVARVDDLPFNGDGDLRTAARTLAYIMLAPTESMESHWVPRADTLDPNDKEDIELLATITARKAIVNHEPVPHGLLKEIGEGGEWWDTSFGLIDAVLVPVPEAVYDRAVKLLDAWSGDAGGFWWRTMEPEPELPFDADPPLTIISTEKDGPF